MKAGDESSAGNVAYTLGDYYSEGDSCKKNIAMAIKYYAMAVQYGSYNKDKAALYLGDYYFIARNFKESFRYYFQYLDDKNGKFYETEDLRTFLTVEFKVAYMFENGLGVNRNYSKPWFIILGQQMLVWLRRSKT